MRSLLCMMMLGLPWAQHSYAQYLQILPASVTISPGQSIQLTATLGAVTGPSSIQNFSWRITSNPPIGTVDQNGLYTAPASITATTSVQVAVTSNVQVPGVTIPLLLWGYASITIQPTPAAAQGPAGPPGPPGPAGPQGPPGPAGSSVQGANTHWQYQEIPSGGYSIPGTAKAYGSGYVLTLKCAPISGTIHLWMSGSLLYEGDQYYDGTKDPAGNPSGLGFKQLAAINFDQGFARPAGDPNASCGSGPCRVFRVDYQYTPDDSGSCP